MTSQATELYHLFQLKYRSPKHVSFQDGHGNGSISVLYIEESGYLKKNILELLSKNIIEPCKNEYNLEAYILTKKEIKKLIKPHFTQKIRG